MSVEFIQVHLPCKQCIVSAACKDKKTMDRETDKNADIYRFLLAMPKFDESKKLYKKGLTEVWANLGHLFLSTCNSSDMKQMVKDKSMAPEFIEVLKEISTLSQWIVNSESWKQGRKFEFDRFEIKRKLKVILGWV